MKKLTIALGGIAAAAVLGGGVAAGALLYNDGEIPRLEGDAHTAVTDIDDTSDDLVRQAQPLYYSFDKPFTVNVGNSATMLQVGVSVSTHYATTVENVKSDNPALRAAVTLALSDASLSADMSDNGKKNLVTGITGIMNQQLKADGYGPTIDAVYFTDFIVQGSES